MISPLGRPSINSIPRIFFQFEIEGILHLVTKIFDIVFISIEQISDIMN